MIDIIWSLQQTTRPLLVFQILTAISDIPIVNVQVFLCRITKKFWKDKSEKSPDIESDIYTH